MEFCQSSAFYVLLHRKFFRIFSILFFFFFPIFSIPFCSILFFYFFPNFLFFLFHSVLFYSILLYSILFCSILFYSILFCSLLFYSMSNMKNISHVFPTANTLFLYKCIINFSIISASHPNLNLSVGRKVPLI